MHKRTKLLKNVKQNTFLLCKDLSLRHISGSGSGYIYFAEATTGYNAKFLLKNLKLGEAPKIYTNGWFKRMIKLFKQLIFAAPPAHFSQ